jgi:autotransporter-associated beta strand protein
MNSLPIMLNATRTITVNSGAVHPELTITGNISDGAAGSGIFKAGTGTLSLWTVLGNTYTGTTDVDKGVFLMNASNGQIVPGTLIIGNGADPANSAIVRENNQSADIFSAAAVTINASGVLDMANQMDTIGMLTGSGTIMMQTASSLTVNNNSTTSQFDGSITGTGGYFSKAGAGTLTLTASSPFTGTTRVTAGTLLLSSPGKPVQGSLLVGTGFGAANSAVCRFSMPNQTANTSAVTVASDGLFDLNNNTETMGDLTVNGGNVTISTVVLTIKNLTMTGGAVRATTGSLSLGGNIIATSNATTGANVVTPVALNATRTITVNSGPKQPDLVINGTVSDGAATSGIFKSGAGTLDLLGSTGNTYTGMTTVSQGVVEMSATVIGGVIIPGPVVIGQAGGVANSAILREINSADIAQTSMMTINTSGVFDLNGHADSIGSITGSGSILLNGNLTTGGDNSSQSYGGLISGTGMLFKMGTGTQTLGGNNTYTGNTFVSDGTLLVNGSQPSSPISVSSGATLGGTGTVGNTTVTGSKISPGVNGPGTLTTGNLLLDSASTVILNLVSGSAGGFGSINVNGTVTLGNSTLTLNVDPNFMGQAVPMSLIHNLGASAIGGTFKNFSEGQMVPLANLSSTFSYMGAGGKDVTLTPINVPPVLTSATMASPNPAGAGQTITFSAPATDGNGDPLTYAWNFGDGSTSAAASPTHSYPTAGTYAVSVTVSDPFGGQVSGSVMVTVNPPLVGTGPDSDGDGFSDSFEIAFGSDPNNPNDTPTGGPATPGLIQPLTLTKASIKLNFAKSNSDSIAFSGTFAVPAGFKVFGAKVAFDISGIAKVFTLDGKGNTKSGGDSFKLGVKAGKGGVAAQTAKFSVLTKGSFASMLAAAGLVGTADVKSKSVNVVFTAIFNKTILQKTQQVTYTAKKGKTGAAK